MRKDFAADGKVNLPDIYAAFPEIGRGAIWNWHKRVIEQAPTNKEIKAAYNAIEDRLANGVAEHLPLVSPGSVAKGGETALKQIDYAHELKRLWGDADKLRSFAIKVDENEPDGYKIKNPVQFEKSMRVRMGLVESGLKLLQEVWDMRTMQMFYELIVDEIGKEDIEVQKRIIVRLAELNSRHGMTMSMRV